MTIAVAAAAVPFEGIFCSTSCGIAKRWTKPPFDAPIINDLCGTSLRSSCTSTGRGHFDLLQTGRALCPSKVWVASDYSDLVPDSSDDISYQGYHPLEEVRVSKGIEENKLTAAEMARTTLEANDTGLLVFPRTAHHEPHDCISWNESHYAVDEFGDIYFHIPDDENILQDRQESNPVIALIGMDLQTYQSRSFGGNQKRSVKGYDNVDYPELLGSQVTDIPADSRMPKASDETHPVYFSKCITKAATAECTKRMDCPSNGVSITGLLKPCFLNEEPYVRRLFNSDDCDDLMTEWEDEKLSNDSLRDDEFTINSPYYRLDIMTIDLFSVYGIQHAVSLNDFLDAEPDALVSAISAIIRRLDKRGVDCNAALECLCKRKGFPVEGANLIGIDSLGIDARVFHGREVQTYRFAFKVQATSESAAEKQMLRLLLPRSRMKKLVGCSKRYRNVESL